MKKENKIQGFKAPEDYFANFEERLQNRITEENLPKFSGFKIPEKYMENLENRILAVIENPKTKSRVIPLFRTKHIAAVAAVAASLVIGIGVLQSRDVPTTMESLELATIDNYIDAGNLNLDFYELTSYITDEDISSLNMQRQLLEDAEIEAYLFENIDADSKFGKP